ncbi:MAG: phosphatase PAP2 family protein [Deltaproteobacteria bacterium]|nr:phosphatase PAP2 family protein [Deltaproteobacteria bacterium]
MTRRSTGGINLKTKKLAGLLLMTIVSLAYPAYGRGVNGYHDTAVDKTWAKVKQDYQHFYSPEHLTHLGIAFGVGGVMANTDLDENIRERFQKDFRSSGTDDISKNAKLLGEGKYLIPLSLLAAGVGSLYSTNPEASGIGEWGWRSARAYLVGGPALLLMQVVTGGSRPGESHNASHWNPLKDSNGVSGHALIGAIPFLTAGRMSESRFLRYLFFTASTAAGWSRINDDAHFASQALLGWYMGWEAVGAVTESEKAGRDFRISPLVLNEGYGLRLSWSW